MVSRVTHMVMGWDGRRGEDGGGGFLYCEGIGGRDGRREDWEVVRE